MYILELIVKLIQKRKMHKSNPYLESEFSEDYEGCAHFYLPIDSSKDYLACNKCGHVIKNLKKNIFKT